jgi:hypothetical protein
MKITAQQRTLLQGKPWTPSGDTNVQKTWRAHGWKPSKKGSARGTSSTYAQQGRTS